MTETEIKSFYKDQVNNWDLLKKNVTSLKEIIKKPFKCFDLQGIVQYNPARAASTLAKVDKENLIKRECFLCEKNRPGEQFSLPIIPSWNLLVNPFPILPYHFTIVSTEHRPQVLSLNTGKQLAFEMEEFVIFYNDNGAGASAPDHAHYQGVPIKSLPLIELLRHNKVIKLPYKIISNENDIKKCKEPVNVFFWQEKNKEIKIIAIPRKNHRPKEFYMETPYRRSISPGAIDMAGIIVTPFENDFNEITNDDIKSIYDQVGFSDD